LLVAGSLITHKKEITASMKCPLVRRSSKKLETAIMPEDVWIKVSAKHQQKQRPERQRRGGVLGSFSGNKAAKMKLRQHYCHDHPQDQEKVSVSTFRRYDWRVEHLPLILKHRADTQDDAGDHTSSTFNESISSLTTETASPPTKEKPILGRTSPLSANGPDKNIMSSMAA
jgi:hypothetical protein